MIESITKRTISSEDIEKLSEDEIEQSIQNNIIMDSISVLKDNINNIVDIDLIPNDDDGFTYETSIIFCSTNDIISKSQIQARMMTDYGLTQEQIDKILEIQVQEMNGF